uniref:uncharacterized protein n=1 Tax=Centroberyx gerrardi TaxID=166262 RepID=UPI003AB03358
MELENYTRVSEFVIVGFPSLQPEYFDLVAWFFFFLYVTTAVGNLLLVVVFAVERSLQKPMYIIMVSLALSDIGFCTVALPKVIARYWWDAGTLSFYACLMQNQLIHYFGTLNSLIMMTMAMDRYLAICFPLRYPKIMTNQLMNGLTVFSWVSAMIAPGIATFQSAQLPFCGPNHIIQCYCDTRSLTQLACGNTSLQGKVSFALAMFVLLVPFSFIIFSYINIIAAVTKMTTAQGRVKTFSTCATQGCIIFIYYIPRFFVYIAPYFSNLTMTADKRIATTLFYSLFPPLINPFIYCLRTKEIKQIFRRWLQRRRGVTPTKPGLVASVTKSVIEGILTAWYDSTSSHSKPRLQCVIQIAEKVVGCRLSSVKDLHDAIMFQVDENYTRVSEFVIVGFPSLQPEYFDLVAWFFFFLYVTTVVGNLLLVVVFAVERSLQKPMYIIMVSLALSDIGFATVALPKLIARYWWNDGTLGFHTCLFQEQMIHYFGSLNSLILMTMALDRYLAICFPLRYPVLMTNWTMTGLTLFFWTLAHIFPGVSTINFTTMPFCRPNRIIHAFCDTMSLTPLVCGDAIRQFSAAFAAAMFILYVPLSFIIFSYICIIISVLRMASGQGRAKTFSTCATQGCIISIYYIPRFFIYSTPYFPNLTMTADKRIATTLFYSLFPPLINPFIYCLRTKEIKQIFRRWLQRRRGVTPTKPGLVASVTK